MSLNLEMLNDQSTTLKTYVDVNWEFADLLGEWEKDNDGNYTLPCLIQARLNYYSYFLEDGVEIVISRPACVLATKEQIENEKYSQVIQANNDDDAELLINSQEFDFVQIPLTDYENNPIDILKEHSNTVSLDVDLAVSLIEKCDKALYDLIADAV